MTVKTANIILVIMALTWAFCSVRLGVLVEVSQNFLHLAGILAAWSGAETAKDALKKWKAGP